MFNIQTTNFTSATLEESQTIIIKQTIRLSNAITTVIRSRNSKISIRLVFAYSKVLFYVNGLIKHDGNTCNEILDQVSTGTSVLVARPANTTFIGV